MFLIDTAGSIYEISVTIYLSNKDYISISGTCKLDWIINKLLSRTLPSSDRQIIFKICVQHQTEKIIFILIILDMKIMLKMKHMNG